MQPHIKSLNTLELPAVLDMLSAEAVSMPAKEYCLKLTPLTNKTQVERLLSETSAAKDMITIKGSPSFGGVKDVRGSLDRANIGGSLNTRELLDIAGLLRAARTVRSYAASDKGKAERSDIDFLFNSLRANRQLEEKITNTITGEDEIADTASSELQTIRRHMRAASSRVREALQKIISSPAYNKALQEPIITMRADRYVVPVKAEHKSVVQGLVHDVSASGATLFIEPLAAVKANNELRELFSKEKKEIERILAELSADCAVNREDIGGDFEILIALDVVFAKAKFSYKLNCCEPTISDGIITLKKARHPLLPIKEAVPINIELGGGYDTLVITGPNTGGKTVTLKTLGILSIMCQCGLHIPAGDGSCLPIFEKVLADIGDEQSIEQSLSTFSSHMTNIVSILDECGENTLLLFDELGAGTDPVEGAALAISIIENARRRGAKIAATTHYAELKVYATTEPGVLNASCEFDVETLRPTYRLIIGIPGKSNAFAISQRLGLKTDIIEDARARISSDNADFEELLEKLEIQRQQMEKERLETSRALRDAQEKHKEAEKIKQELEKRLDKSNDLAREEAREIIEKAKDRAEAMFSEFEALKKRADEEDSWREMNDAKARMRRSFNEAEEELLSETESEPKAPKKSAREARVGDTVELLNIGEGIKAHVLEISSDGDLLLQAGIMKITATQDEVFLLEDENVIKFDDKNEGSSGGLRESGGSSEVDLRGMTADEAIPIMEMYIDNSTMNKLHTVTVIHGKGTGALRQAVQRSLRTNKQVKSFRLGRYGEGESGVTVVELK